LPTKWIELSVTCDPEAVEAVTELFSRYVEGGVAIEEPYTLHDDGQAHQPLLGAPVTVRAYVADDAAGEERRLRVQEGLWYLGRIDVGKVGGLETKRVAEDDWANAWKEFYHVTHLGARTVIKPSWREYEAQPGEMVIELDPGMAFGTGLHPTTRQCLEAVGQIDLAGRDVLDVGTGSGILAVGALKRGAARVVAVDTDPLAVRAAAENTRRNAVSIEVVEGSAVDVPGAFDVVLANLVADVLVRIAPDLRARLRPGGTLVCAGIVREKEDAVSSALAGAGFAPRGRDQREDWVRLDLA
jgi:ribosomal protein L11 methyltransferase